MEHVFVSYVREDQELIDHLVTQLKRQGIEVWLDREQIRAGQRWQSAIATAIEEGAFFLSCFSKAYEKRGRSYVHEELTIAIEQLRQRPTDRAWFIPVLLDECSVPDRRIGAGETLRNIQWVDLHENWDRGLRQLVAVLAPARLTLDQVLDKLDLPPIPVLPQIKEVIGEGRYTPIIGSSFCPGVDLLIRDTMLSLVNRSNQEWVDMENIAESAFQHFGKNIVKENIARCLADPKLPFCESYRLLAHLPIPVYLTINYDDQLMKALTLIGKQPVFGTCYEHWDEKVEPTVERPLIFHFFGQKEIPDSLALSENDYRDSMSVLSKGYYNPPLPF